MPTASDLLAFLREKRSGHTSGEDLSDHFGVSRTAIWKHVHQLEQVGYIIEAIPHLGYRLISTPDRLLPDEIQAGLSTRRFGRQIKCFQETTSTNDRALELAATGAAEGTLVAAEHQTRGRGRRDRTWLSKPQANLLFTLIFRPPWTAEQVPLVTLLMAAAIAQAIRAETGLAATIKWPNDILVKDLKVAGILAEMQAQSDAIAYVVCGAGINVNHSPASGMRQPAVSLAKLAGRPIARLPLLRRVLTLVEGLYLSSLGEGPSVIINAWKKLSCMNGAQVRVELAGHEVLEGMVLGVDLSGGLLVRLDSGLTRRIGSGEVTQLRR